MPPRVRVQGILPSIRVGWAVLRPQGESKF